MSKTWNYHELLEHPNLVELWEKSVEKWPENRLFGTKNKNGDYEWETYRDVDRRIKNIRGGLAALGVTKGDCVGIIAGNRTEWFTAENATHGLNARWVPMYEKELESVWEYIINDAAVKVLFVSTIAIYKKVEHLLQKSAVLEKIIVIEAIGSDSILELEKLGEKHPVPAVYPEPEDIADLIYTSGTTGAPKGVLLTHGNLTFCSRSGYNVFPNLNERSVSLSHLPWAHSYGLSAELHNLIQFGASIGFMESVDTLADDLQKVKPTVLISVPRVFNKIYNGIYQRMDETGGIILKLFNQAVAEARSHFFNGKGGIKYRLLDKTILSMVRKKFGGKLELVLTASAQMNKDIALFFYSIGIPCYDAYGMTETSPALTMNSPTAYKFATVGKPLMNTTIVIDKTYTGEDSEDGEILAFGPQVMVGYHHKPEETEKVIVHDEVLGRGVRTGDRGKLDADGFLHITGRFKEEYKLLNGKYVHPDAIETDIKLLPYVANSLVFGHNREYNVAIIVPDTESLRTLAAEAGVDDADADTLHRNEKIREMITERIRANLKGKFGGYEIPKRFLFIKEDFTVENGLQTQTMKLKRKAVIDKYQEELDALYK